MGAGKERPPAFELDVAADAETINFPVPGRCHTRSEGVASAEHSVRRKELPNRVRQDEHYTDVHASLRIAAWLEDADGSRQS